MRAVIGLLIVGLGTLVVPLDSSVNVDFPAIVANFGLLMPMIQWVVISYVLTQTSLMLTFGRIGDMLGYRRIFLFGTGISTLAFVACALAPSYPALLAGRVAQGIGAGLILSVGPALATSLFPEAVRARVLGHYMLMFGLGTALGPSVFGPVVQHYGWSSVFAARAPIAGLAFTLAWTLPRSPHAASEKFDAAGGVLLAVATAAMLLALNQARTPLVGIPCALLAAAGFVIFYRHETRFPRPIIDFAHFRQPGFTLINLTNALLNLATFAIMLLAPFYLHDVANLTLPQSGLVLAASPAGIVLGAPLAGFLAGTVAPRRIARIGLAAAAAGLFGISLAGAEPVLPALAATMVLQGLGVGLFQVAYLDIVTAAIPLAQRGVAGALSQATRTLGTVAGATVLMLVFQSIRGPAQDAPSVLAAFQAAFEFAAALPAAMLLIDLLIQRRNSQSSTNSTALITRQVPRGK